MSIIGRLTFGWLGDIVDKRYLFMVSYAIQGLGILTLMDAQEMGAVYLYALLFGIGFGTGIPLNPAIRGEYFGRAAFGRIQGLMAPVTMVGAVIGPFFIGHFYDITGTYRFGFLGAALLIFLAAVIILFARPVDRYARR